MDKTDTDRQTDAETDPETGRDPELARAETPESEQA